ncbi:cadherin-4-like [Lethenteron reissneri]|uniref:cadherin-4-like n=1 Tax=Lethenteron reissneri TaxID=7753 RepID=UPI002AB72685|nr:cadherin-4-like [Lethenteron reissneri]
MMPCKLSTTLVLLLAIWRPGRACKASFSQDHYIVKVPMDLHEGQFIVKVPFESCQRSNVQLLSSDPHFKVLQDGSVRVAKSFTLHKHRHQLALRAKHHATGDEWKAVVELHVSKHEHAHPQHKEVVLSSGDPHFAVGADGSVRCARPLLLDGLHYSFVVKAVSHLAHREWQTLITLAVRTHDEDTHGKHLFKDCKHRFESEFYSVAVPPELPKGAFLLNVLFERCGKGHDEFEFSTSDARFTARPDGSLHAASPLRLAQRTVPLAVAARHRHSHQQWLVFVSLFVAKPTVRRVAVPLHGGHQQQQQNHRHHLEHEQWHHKVDWSPVGDLEPAVTCHWPELTAKWPGKLDAFKWPAGIVIIPEHEKGPFPRPILIVKSDKHGGEHKLHYSLTGAGADQHPAGLFSVEGATGVISVNKPLDHELRAVYKLKLRLTDAHDHELEVAATITVLVVDLNEEPPVFAEKEFHGSVLEESKPGTFVLKLSASDKDDWRTLNGRVTYRIVEQEPKSPAPAFSVHEHTGVVSVASERLDREAVDKYRLVVKALDSDGLPCALYSLATVVITVADINDHPPVITGFQVLGPIRENKENETVAIVAIEDADEQFSDNWRVKCSLVSGNEDGHFGVITDPKTNKAHIYLRKPIEHDVKKVAALKLAVKNIAPLVVFYPLHDGGHLDGGSFYPYHRLHDQHQQQHPYLHHHQHRSALGHLAATHLPKDDALVAVRDGTSFGHHQLHQQHGGHLAPCSSSYDGCHHLHHLHHDHHRSPPSRGVVTTGLHGSPLGGALHTYPGGHVAHGGGEGLAAYGVAVVSNTIAIPLYRDSKAADAKLVVYKAEGLKAGSLIASFQPKHLCGHHVVKHEKMYDPAKLLTIDATGDITLLRELDRESPYIKNDVYTAIFLAIDDAAHPCTATATVLLHVADVNDNAPTLRQLDDVVCKKSAWNSVLVKAHDADLDPHAGPFTFKLLPPHAGAHGGAHGDGHAMWQLKQKDDHTAALTLLHGHAPTDVYKVSVHVSDHKGLGETHHLHVTVCDCGSERMCHPYTEYGLSAGALAAIICSLLLVPLALVAALLICKCKKKKHQSVCQKAIHVEECSLGTVRPYNKDGGEEQQPMAMRCPPVSCSGEDAGTKPAGTVLVHQDC